MVQWLIDEMAWGEITGYKRISIYCGSMEIVKCKLQLGYNSIIMGAIKNLKW